MIKVQTVYSSVSLEVNLWELEVMLESNGDVSHRHHHHQRPRQIRWYSWEKVNQSYLI